MKYCGCGYGCQNSCGYPRIRMRSSDTPLIKTSITTQQNELKPDYVGLPAIEMDSAPVGLHHAWFLGPRTKC